MKKILGIAILMMMISVSAATEIRFSPDVWSLGKWCMTATDIVIDTQNQEIAATDIVIESSLEFVDFVPSSMFPYFLPPKTNGNIVHLVGFTTDPAHRVLGKWSIGTLYMKQKDMSSADGSLKLYFTKKWDTTDSNLSIAWWVDVLDTIGSAYYTFDGTGICAHTAADINGGIAETTLQDMAQQVSRTWTNIFFNRKTLLAFGGILIVGIILFMYYKKNRQWKNK